MRVGSQSSVAVTAAPARSRTPSTVASGQKLWATRSQVRILPGAPTAIGVGQAGWRASSEGRHPTSAMKVGIDAPDPPAGGGDRARGTCAAWAAKERRLLAVLALHLGEAVGYDLDAAFGELGADPPARPFLAALAALAASRRRLHGRRRRRLRQGPRPRGTQQRPAVPLLPLVALPWPGR